MKLGHNTIPFHMKQHIQSAKTYTLFYDFMVLDVYHTEDDSLSDRVHAEILFVHQADETYYQSVHVISAPSIHTLNVYISDYMKQHHYDAFMSLELYEVREYPSKQDLYLHALVEYGATSLKVKLRQLGLM